MSVKKKSKLIKKKGINIKKKEKKKKKKKKRVVSHLLWPNERWPNHSR